MLDNGVFKVNFKGFVADNTHATWNAVKKVYGDGDLAFPLEGCERTCLFHWSTNLDRTTKNISDLHCNINTNISDLHNFAWNTRMPRVWGKWVSNTM